MPKQYRMKKEAEYGQYEKRKNEESNKKKIWKENSEISTRVTANIATRCVRE